MLRYIVIFILFILLPFCGQAQIKGLFKDKNDGNRTIVIKEKAANDYQILEDQFGDAKVGEVIRITTVKAKPEKIKEEIPVRTVPERAKPIRVQKETPKRIIPKKPKPVKKEAPKKVEAPKVKKQINRPDGPSGIPGTYPVKERPKMRKRVRVKKGRKVKVSRQGACYQF